MEVFGILTLPVALALDAVNWQFALFLFLVAYGYGLWLTSCSLLLEELTGSPYARFTDRLRLAPWMLVETFGYRQLTVIWRLRGLWRYLRRSSEWGAMARRGFARATVDQGGAARR